jgi:hypothetical protein
VDAEPRRYYIPREDGREIRVGHLLIYINLEHSSIVRSFCYTPNLKKLLMARPFHVDRVDRRPLCSLLITPIVGI